MTTSDSKDDSRRDVQWEYFVTQDKQASRIFDELCRGLAQIIRRLEPRSSCSDLSPRQLNNFYSSCGQNYDELFTNTGEHGLSWIYRTIGCYHSLQPTQNAFEPPSIPCLTDDGYVRWQTMQLLLCPQEHITFIQTAVEIYDVPRRNGGFFPKKIPQSCFPSNPDVEMEKWHRFVTSQIDKETYMRRLKYSPYSSPQTEGNRSDGYFASQHTRKPSRGHKRTSLSEEELARREAARRRSSVPNIVTPGASPYADRDSSYSRSHSANRPNSGTSHARQRPNGSTPTHYHTPPTSSSRLSNSGSRRPDDHLSVERNERRRDMRDGRTYSGSRQSSADDASSEESYNRPQRDDDPKRKSRWGASLMPSFFLSKSQRRHSSDGRVPTLKDGDDRPPPKRNESIRRYRTEELARPGVQFYNNQADRPTSGVRFEDSLPPETSTVPPNRAEDGYAPPPSSYRYPDAHLAPMNTQPAPNVTQIPPTPPGSGPNEANYFEANPPPLPARKQGLPIRITTNSGVNGRRYVPQGYNEPLSAGETYRPRDRTYSLRNPATSTVI